MKLARVRVAILTALPWERRALLRAAPGARRLPDTPFPTWLVSQRAGGLLLVQSGMGEKRTQACADWTIEAAPGAALLFLGCAGGLDPDLQAGSAVVADTIRTQDLIFRCDLAWPGRLTDAALHAGLRVRHAGILAVTSPLLSVASKHQARVVSGAVAVDMESGMLARRATAAGRSFAVGRVILDDARTDIGPIPAFVTRRRLLSRVETQLEAWLRGLLALDSASG